MIRPTTRRPLIGLGACLIVLALAAPAAAQQRFAPRVQAQIDALEEEPSIQQAQTAALRFFNVDPGSVEAMRSRASWKGIMPSLSAGYRHSVNDLAVRSRNTEVNQFPEDGPNIFDDATGNVQELQVSASWNLPLLVFNAEVLDVGSLAVLQEGVLKEVTRLYFTRRRLQLDLILNPPADAGTRMSKELRIAELTSTLDAMTGQLFSKAEARRARLDRRGSFDDD